MRLQHSSRCRAAWSLLGLSVATAALAAAPLKAVEKPRQPNFIVILGEGAGWTSTSVQMDDRNPASRGTGVKTPSLERLAAAGMRFSDGYAASPRCTPSRAALLTGRSPAALQMTFVGDGNRGGALNTRLLPPRASLELPQEETTLAELLKRGGYATAHFGKWHLGREHPSRHGFDESDGPTGNGGPENVADPNPKQALEMTAHGVDFMERQAKAGRPFYLQLSHYPSQEEKRGGQGGGRGANPELQRKELSVADQSVGALLDAVERLGLRAQTYVLYTTDHGTPGRNLPLSGGKGTVWEGGIRVPFLVAGPGVAAGACSHVRVSATDLLPTLAELAGSREPLPRSVEGGSFASLLRAGGAGTMKRPREEFVLHFPHYDKGESGPASALLLGNYKLVRLYETDQRLLFDLSSDPSERTDLATRMPEKAAELDRRLASYLKAVNAQLPVPNPEYDPSRPSETQPRGKRGGRGAQPQPGGTP